MKKFALIGLIVCFAGCGSDTAAIQNEPAAEKPSVASPDGGGSKKADAGGAATAEAM